MAIFHCGVHEVVGTTEEVITITGLQATDIAFAIKSEGSAVYVEAIETSADTLTIQFSADSQGENINVLILRP